MVKIIFLILIAITNIFASERFAVPYNPDIDLTKSAKTFECYGIKFVVDISRPPTPFKNLTLNLKAKKGDKYITDLKIEARFNMKMDMGNYVYPLKNIKDEYTLNFILPKCVWGDKRWFIKIIISDGSKSCEKILLFDMDR